MTMQRREERAKHVAPRPEDVVLFNVGEMRFAIAAGLVEEIRNLDGLVPRTDGGDARLAKVEFVLTKRSAAGEATYFVVNAAKHFRLPGTKPTRLLLLRDLHVAVLVDGIDRMMQVHSVQALSAAFTGSEREWYRGLAVMEGRVVPMVDPACFLKKEEMVLLAMTKTAAVPA